MTGSCRRCGAPIRWAITLTGRRMPLDPGTSDDGNVATWTGPSGQLRARVLTKGEPPGAHEQRATPHFATCPNWKTRR